MLLRVTING